MPGFSSNDFGNDLVFAKNVDFSGQAPHADTMLTNGQLLIASTALNLGGTHINVGTLTSPDSSITIGYSSPNITLQANGAKIGETITGNTGGALSPVLGNWNILGGVLPAGTTPVQTNGSGNTLVANIQTSQAIASADATKIGLSNFDSAHFTVTSTGFVSTTAFNQPGVANLGISLSGTTFTVNSANGTALSATNPGFVTLQSLANPGQLITYKITANQSFTQAQLGNNLFGVTTGVAFAADAPFYLYAVSNANNGENTIAFMISRVPHRAIAPLAANIAQSGNTNATTQGSFYSLPAITAADYASAPCLAIGSFRQQYSGSLWTVSTLNNSDGIGQFNELTVFSQLKGTFGAGTNSYFLANGGVAPIFSTNQVTYFVKKNGTFIYTSANGNCTTGGTIGTLLLTTPYLLYGGPVGNFFIHDGVNNITYIGIVITLGATNGLQSFVSANPGSGQLVNASITANAGTLADYSMSAEIFEG